MVASDSFAAFLDEQLAPLDGVVLRRMFGSTGLFCDGLLFGIVHDDTLYFRVDEGNREQFREAESESPFTYMRQGRTVELAYWRVPERLIDEPDELVDWAHAALAAAQRVAARRQKRRPRRAAT